MKMYLDIKETEQLEKAATNQRDELLIRLLFYLGCRVFEALALEVKGIDFARGMVTIEHLKSRIKLSCPWCGASLGETHIFCSRCGAEVKEVVAKQQEHRRIRALPLDKDTLEMLRDYINHGGLVKQKGERPIFGINRYRAWQIIKQCAERARLPKLVNPEKGKAAHNVSPHRLRDAFAVHTVKLDDSGDRLRLLQERLDHQSFNTSAKYRKVAGEEHRKWYQRLWECRGMWEIPLHGGPLSKRKQLS